MLNLRRNSTLSGLPSLGFNTLGSSVAGIQHSRVFRRWDSTLSDLPSLGFNTLGSSVAGIQHSRVLHRWDSTLSGLPSLGFNTFSDPPSLGLKHSRVYINTFFVMVLRRKAERKRVMSVSWLMMLSWRRAEASSASRLTTQRPEKNFCITCCRPVAI